MAAMPVPYPGAASRVPISASARPLQQHYRARLLSGMICRVTAGCAASTVTRSLAARGDCRDHAPDAAPPVPVVPPGVSTLASTVCHRVGTSGCRETCSVAWRLCILSTAPVRLAREAARSLVPFTLEERGMSAARTRTAKSERDQMHALHGALCGILQVCTCHVPSWPS